jgi:AcrR family transcriptional regulator
MDDSPNDLNPDDEKIIRAAMDVAASKGWERCSFSEIAAAAGMDSDALARRYRDKTGILRALAERIDTEALEGIRPTDDTDIPIRERLLEMLMLRFDAMTPHKAGITSVARSALSTPRLALEGAPSLARSMRATLAAAEIATSGPLGLIRVKMMTLIFLDAFRVWINDESPDISATMRRLDERLGQAEKLALTLGIAKPTRSV